METINCHSCETIWATIIRNISHVEANIINFMISISFIPYAFLKADVKILKKNTIYIAMTVSDWTKFVQIIEDYSRNVAVKI